MPWPAPATAALGIPQDGAELIRVDGAVAILVEDGERRVELGLGRAAPRRSGRRPWGEAPH
eukprot:6362892-Prymnesium_polylepis.2